MNVLTVGLRAVALVAVIVAFLIYAGASVPLIVAASAIVLALFAVAWGRSSNRPEQ
jgi:hypothetical protein